MLKFKVRTHGMNQQHKALASEIYPSESQGYREIVELFLHTGQPEDSTYGGKIAFSIDADYACMRVEIE